MFDCDAHLVASATSAQARAILDGYSDADSIFNVTYFVTRALEGNLSGSELLDEINPLRNTSSDYLQFLAVVPLFFSLAILAALSCCVCCCTRCCHTS